MPRPPSLDSIAGRVRELIARTGATPRPRDAASVEREFNELALDLFAAQFEADAAYRRVCEVRGVQTAGVTDWRGIPAVPTVAFKELELTCLPPEARAAVFHSSGTTRERPGRHFHSRESLALYEASAWAGLRANVLDAMPPVPRLLALTPPPAAAPHSSLVRMFEAARSEMREPESCFIGTVDARGAWSLDCEALTSRLRDAAASDKPVLLLGTAFSSVHLLDELVQHGERIALPAGSRVLETGGYKGRSRELPRAELHTLLTGRLGVPPRDIVTEYGMCELSSQAYPHRHSAPDDSDAPCVMHFPPWARARVISPESGAEVGEGETGLLCVVDLANVWSVSAILTGDLAVRRGTGFELLGRASQAGQRGCSLMAA